MKTTSLLTLAFVFFSTLTINSQTITYRDHTFRIEPELKLTDANNPDAKWGLYFWEFGNGDYKMTDEPKVFYDGYTKNESQKVKVQVVPYYTVVGKPVQLQANISVKKGNSKSKYQMEDRSVHLESSANGEVVPGHEIRVALHYKSSVSQADGYLAFFYNNIDEKEEKLNISFDPFISKDDYGLHHQEVLLKQIPNLSGNQSGAYSRLKNEHENVLIFKTNQLKAGEARRIFLSLTSDEKLKKSTGDKNHTLSFTALWLPGSGAFDASKHEMQYSMKVLKVHDPNKMKVKPKVAYFRKGEKQTFVYTIHFQNEEKGITRDARIAVFLGDGLDKSTLKVTKMEAIDKRMKWNPNCSEIQKANRKCFEIDSLSHPDSLFFTFYNIDLPGPKFFNRKRSKGRVEFSIQSNGIKVPKTKSRVGISLDDTDPVITNWAKTKWRQKGLFLKTGVNLNGKLSDYTSANDKLTDRLALGLNYQNAPVGSGLSWGWSLDYASYRIQRDSQISITSDIVPNGGVLSQTEKIKLNLAEAQLYLGYQFSGNFKVFVTSGISMPVASKLDYSAKVERTIDATTIIEDKVNSVFGVFGKNIDPTIFNKTINTRSFIGYVGSIGIEAGALDAFTVGVKGQFRYYNTFYYTNHDCYKMTNLEAYIRFKLFTL